MANIPVSTNSFAKQTLAKAMVGWEGDNITSNAFGFDDIFSGVPFGIGELGGINHFKGRTQVTIAH